MRHRDKTLGQPAGAPPECAFLTPGELDAWMEGSCPAERRRAFEEHLASGCEDCLYLVADLDVFRDLLKRGVGRVEQAAFERQAPLIEKRLWRRAMGRSGRGIHAWSSAAVLLAACALVVLSLSSVFLGQGAASSSIRLPDGGVVVVEAMDFARPPTLRGGADPAQGWRAAGNAYRGQNYHEAERLLALLGEEGPQGADALLYRGICQLRMGEYEEARGLLSRARQRARSEDLPEGAAAWFEGVSQLALGHLSEARRALEASRDAGGIYASRAADLLDRL